MSIGKRGDRARRERFEALYAAHYAAIYAYAHRRLGDAVSEVPDVVANVFAVAWRRLDEVPAGADGLPWLYGLARHSLMNDRRSRRRRRLLFDRLAREASVIVNAPASASETLLTQAVERLPDLYREVLQLVSWDACTHTEAAQVLGCSVNAVALRVHKAKARLLQDPAVAEYLRPSQPETDRLSNAQRK